MRKFIGKFLLFVSVLVVSIVVLALLPSTPRARRSLIFSNLRKDSLLQNVQSPRLIFVGGSNLSFGLNSRLIRDSLRTNPINTGIHMSIGLVYMMDDAARFIRAADTVILIPEYQHFFGKFADGYDGEELTHMVFDLRLANIRLLHFRQWLHVLQTLPAYASEKLAPASYIPSPPGFYDASAFNEYGDACKHWGAERRQFNPYERVGNTALNMEVFGRINEFRVKIEKRKAVLYVSYPDYQATSFQKSRDDIRVIDSLYKRNGYKLLGTPERYMIPDSLMFDTPYHLTKKAADYRTACFIEDFRKARRSYL